MIQININDIANKVRATVLTGLNTALTGVIVATDTVIDAFGKLQNQINGKQDTLVSGNNIKTINTNSVLGSGDLSVGTVTSVGLTTGTTGTDVNVANSPVTGSGSITLNVPTASASNRGALSSTDWSTFNNKVSTGVITGSGLTMATSRLLGRTTAGSGAVEEISIGSGLTLSGGTLDSTGGGITVGTTPVTSGTVGRIFFQGTGDVVQQDSTLFWDNTNKRLGVGATPASTVRLDVRAQGALSTDIAFRVRNSADTDNIFSVNGDNTQTWLAPTNNQLSTIKSGTYNFIQWGNENFNNIAIGYNLSNLFTPTDGYNVLIGGGTSIGSGVSEAVRIGTFGSTTGLGSINIGYASRASGQYTIKIGRHNGASSFGGTNSIHLGRTVSGNHIIADDVFMTYFNSQSCSTVVRSNGSLGLFGQQNYLITNGTGANGLTTFMGDGGNTLVVRNHTSIPSLNITDSFQQYSADRGGVAGKASAHFRAEDGTINVIGDLSGFGTSTPGARLDVRAQGALSTDIAFRVRNSADTDNLIETAGTGLVKFRTGTERIEINTSASDYKMSLYKFGVEMTRLSTYSSYFCVGGSNQYLGVGTSSPSHLLDINTVGGQKQIVTRFGNEFNSTTQSDVSLKFTTAYCGGFFGGNPLAYLTVGNNGGVGVNNNAKSYFKFELLKNNTLAERASITSQSNLLLQAPTEDTNDVGVIYIPNGTAPTASITDGYKQYSADIVAGNAAPHFRTENGDIVKLYRVGGWGLPTGTFTRTTFDTATVTTAQLAERVAALIQDLRDNHGLLKA